MQPQSTFIAMVWKLEMWQRSICRICAATVVGQSPSADAKDLASPRIGLAVSASDNAEQYVMPSFVGKPAQESAEILEKSGFKLGNGAEASKRPIASPNKTPPNLPALW